MVEQPLRLLVEAVHGEVHLRRHAGHEARGLPRAVVELGAVPAVAEGVLGLLLVLRGQQREQRQREQAGEARGLGHAARITAALTVGASQCRGRDMGTLVQVA
jgi:hypothetical protein